MASKPIDTTSILIQRIVVHDIPKHNKGEMGIEPSYSKQESVLKDGLRLFFKEKIKQAIQSHQAFRINFDEESSSPISWIVNEILESDGTNIVLQSKEIAKHLFESQAGHNAAGILVVVYGKVNDHNTCMILKLERDTGAQLTLDPKTQTYNIDEVQNLMLTQKTKILKVAMFILRTDFNASYDGIITDYQIDMKEKREVISWFMTKFMGCVPSEAPKIVTQRFYNYTRAYINTIDETLTRVKYLQDLNSYVQTNRTILSPKEFAELYLGTADHKNKYKSFLDTKKLRFTSSFPKDISQIDRHIKKIEMEFENGISIIGKDGTFKKNVKLEKLDDGQFKAEIISKIRKVI